MDDAFKQFDVAFFHMGVTFFRAPVADGFFVNAYAFGESPLATVGVAEGVNFVLCFHGVLSFN